MSKLIKNYNLCAADKMEHFNHLMSGAEFSIFKSLVITEAKQGGAMCDADMFITDLELCGYNGRITAHSALLVPLSPFIANMTRNINFCQNVTKIILADFSVEAIRNVLQLLYTGEIPRLDQQLALEVGDCLKVLGIRSEVVKSCSANVLNSVSVAQKASISDEVIPIQPSKISRNVSSLSSFDILDVTATTQEETLDAAESGPGDVNGNYEVNPPYASVVEDVNMTTYSEGQVGNEFECQHCDFKSKYWSKVIQHSIFDHSGCEFTCSFCDYKAYKLATVKTHEYHKHIGRGRVQCSICGFKTKNAVEMSKHLSKDHTQVQDDGGVSANTNKRRKRT